jgi:hypothetical protein
MVGAGGSDLVWCGSGVVRVRRGQDNLEGSSPPAVLYPVSSGARVAAAHTGVNEELNLSAVLVLGRGMYRRALMGTRWVTGEPDMMLLHA